MSMPKIVIIDRDGTINLASGKDGSPFYYILRPIDLILKQGAKDALAIIYSHNAKIYLATKQRCISKGLATWDQIKEINAHAENLLGIRFSRILIEPEHKTKALLYEEIIKENPDVILSDIILFDDSPDELKDAEKLGLRTADGKNLYAEVCRIFEVR